MLRAKKLDLIVEFKDDYYWGYIRTDGSDYFVNGHGDTLDEMIQNIKEIVVDYINNEGKNDTFWNNADLNNIEIIRLS